MSSSLVANDENVGDVKTKSKNKSKSKIEDKEKDKETTSLSLAPTRHLFARGPLNSQEKQDPTLHWQFEHQALHHRPARPYHIVVECYPEQRAERDDVEGDHHRCQWETLAWVGCLQIFAEGSGAKRKSDDSLLFHKFPPSMFYSHLKPLLDGAARIYCLSEVETYGHLKCSSPVLSDAELTQFNQYFPVMEPETNPLTELQGDPFTKLKSNVKDSKDSKDSKQSPMPFVVPLLPEPTEIVKPIVPGADGVDKDWLELIQDPSVAQKVWDDHAKAVEAHAAEVEAAPPLEVNREDTPDIQQLYRQISRWIGFDKDRKLPQKPIDLYFPEQIMMAWRLKTTSVLDDLGTSPTTELVELVSKNSKAQIPTYYRSRMDSIVISSPINANSIINQKNEEGTKATEGNAHGASVDCLSLHELKDVSWADDALKMRLATLADVCIHVYVLGLALLCDKKDYSKSLRRFQVETMSTRVTLRLPGLHSKYSAPPIETKAKKPATARAPRKPRKSASATSAV